MKRKALIAAVCAVTALLSVACAKGDLPGESDTIVVSGFAYEKVSGTPLAGVCVVLSAYEVSDGLEIGSSTAFTGDDGAYIVALNPARRNWFYELEASDANGKYASAFIELNGWDGSSETVELQNFWMEKTADN